MNKRAQQGCYLRDQHPTFSLALLRATEPGKRKTKPANPHGSKHWEESQGYPSQKVFKELYGKIYKTLLRDIKEDLKHGEEDSNA